MTDLPQHLQKYIVTQNYDKYTSIDQACWRFVLKQLKNFLSTHAHECYLRGLDETGISIESIPKISDISGHLEKFGWRALPVSGFIPPAAFMELQSLGILPIASDMRSIEHLSYTPAPDIVHEAAGHAPILIHPEFAAYLKQYASIAKNAIISSEDLDLYEAIRILSDLKESPSSTVDEIIEAQKNLDSVSKKMSHVSEAGELSRMNWWTAEYGLIGDLENPQIFGAGLLSSVGESRWCLSPSVKKIPLSISCIKQSYDITEPQPQLFVAKDFKHLSDVLAELANTMAFQTGGTKGLDKAIKAKTVNTAVLSTGVQVSGKIESYLTNNEDQVIYFRTQGPTQLSYNGKQIEGHSKQYHHEGYSTCIGLLDGESICLSKASPEKLGQLGIEVGKNVVLQFASGIRVSGKINSLYRNTTSESSLLQMIQLQECSVKYKQQIIFEPNWGPYDLALATHIPSVFGGPADPVSFADWQDFSVKRVQPPSYTSSELELHALYQTVRNIRMANDQTLGATQQLKEVSAKALQNFPDAWLLFLEIFELCIGSEKRNDLAMISNTHLTRLSKDNETLKTLISEGLALAEVH